jgi:RNA polymerase sigma factor (sigma-70 family)
MESPKPPKFKIRPLTEAQRRLADEHQELVVKVAKKMLHRFDPSNSLDELISYGYEGLVKAAKDYDPALGTTFEGYAFHAVSGAIKSGVRGSSWYTRTQHRKFKDAQRIEMLREQQAKLSETLEHLADFLAGSPAAQRVSMAEAADRAAEGMSPESAVHRARIEERIRKATEDLQTVERELVNGYYFEQQKLDEVGARLGLTKSWASRLLSRAVQKIAAAFKSDK